MKCRLVTLEQALGSLMLVPPYLPFPVALMPQLPQLQQVSIEWLEGRKLLLQNILGKFIMTSKHLKRGLGLSVCV